MINSTTYIKGFRPPEGYTWEELAMGIALSVGTGIVLGVGLFALVCWRAGCL